MKNKTCKHKWVFDKALEFKKDSFMGSNYYRTVYHCEKCMIQNIQTVYR